MNNQNKPPFGIVQFHLCKHFDLDPKEYLYLDQVSNLQAGKLGKCTAPNDYFADLLNMSVRGIQKMNKRLVEKGLLVKLKGTEKRATDLFVNAKNGQLEHEQSSPNHEQSSPQTMNKVHGKHEQSSPNKESISNSNKKSNNGKDKKDSLAADVTQAITNLCPYSSDRGKEEWQAFWKHREQLYTKTRKYPITLPAVERMSKKLAKFTEAEGIEAIDKSIMSGYSDLYPKESKQPKQLSLVTSKLKTGTSY